MENRATARRPLIAVAIAVFCAAVATPCSFDDAPILHFDARPDAPVERYVDGQLGILQPTYARSHLVVAWRHLSGKPLSPAEREGFRDLLLHRLKEEQTPRVSGAEQWERLRTLIRGVAYKWAPSGTKEIQGTDAWDLQWIENCTDDAFATAAVTLAARVKTFGAASPAVASWLEAQEQVFANCDEGENRIPEAAATLPAAIRADREYQIAAADFYAWRYDAARERFLTIANDEQSPWRQTSRLVATRALVRAESLDVPLEGIEDPLGLADKELRAILADASMTPLHPSTWRVLAYTAIRRDPQARFDELTRTLMNGGETDADRARNTLADYTLLWDRKLTNDADLTDWVRSFQAGNGTHALERWQATNGTHWLIAALAFAKAEDAATPALLEASKKIAADSPASVMAAHHRARLLTDRDAMRAELDRVLARTDVPQSARNQLIARRRGLARSLDEFVRDATVTIVGRGEEPSDPETLLADEAAQAINQWMPLEMMDALAKHASLPEELRGRVANAAATRRRLLDTKDDDFAFALELARDPMESPYVGALDADRFPSPWWCRYPGGEEATPVPLFLEGQVAAEAELETLTDLGSGGTWVLRQILARARSHPGDERVPEALSLAIKAVRHTCHDNEVDELAEQAFGVLHRRYGKTKWAMETEYWYRSGS
jgi:hypothetical protein